MGTNFYWTPPGQEFAVKAGEVEPLHIGKRSGAGGGLCSWSLRGHQDAADAPIDSWARWKGCLLSGGTITDEYGAERDAQDFIAEVESTTPENRRRQYDWIQQHQDEPMVAALTGDEWLCPDGFSFTYREFL